jgi:hypothetical protein
VKTDAHNVLTHLYSQIVLDMDDQAEFLRCEMRCITAEGRYSPVEELRLVIAPILAIRTDYPSPSAPQIMFRLLVEIIEKIALFRFDPNNWEEPHRFDPCVVPSFDADLRVALLSTVQRWVDEAGVDWIESAADALEGTVEECKAGWYDLDVASVIQNMRDRQPPPEL